MRSLGVDNPYLISLDGDNLIELKWLPWLFKHLDKDDNDTGAHIYSGSDAGCTGRVGIWRATFDQINGYEENMPHPGGYEDVEMPRRAYALHGQNRGKCHERSKRGSVTGYTGCGYSLPNDDDPAISGNDAKTKNCDPRRCLAMNGKKQSWGAQNSKNMNWCYKFNPEGDPKRWMEGRHIYAT
jgi:hypothetical protein